MARFDSRHLHFFPPGLELRALPTGRGFFSDGAFHLLQRGGRCEGFRFLERFDELISGGNRLTFG